MQDILVCRRCCAVLEVSDAGRIESAKASADYRALTSPDHYVGLRVDELDVNMPADYLGRIVRMSLQQRRALQIGIRLRMHGNKGWRRLRFIPSRNAVLVVARNIITFN